MMFHTGCDGGVSALGDALRDYGGFPGLLRWGRNERFCLDFGRPCIMGILNVTSDSFSGDGLLGCGKGADAVEQGVEQAVERGVEMARLGADIIDVGGESTRPSAQPISTKDELARVVGVVAALARRVAVPISVDTSKLEVMEAALDAGAGMINDVSALGMAGGDDRDLLDPRKAALLANAGVPIVLMHRRGRPEDMQNNPQYGDVVGEVYDFLNRRIAACQENGIDKRRLLVDVGIGFGKSVRHNLELLRCQRVFRGLGVPLLLGVSRKRIVGFLSGEETPHLRDVGSHVLAVFGMLTGASVFRVHDVAGARQALATAWGWMNDGELMVAL
ncbi:MAG: dihydropteroate synthase [Magnetococcales bacterium]|nr:dihydropteroate synthase [Magnetococcales bacterium]